MLIFFNAGCDKKKKKTLPLIGELKFCVGEMKMWGYIGSFEQYYHWMSNKMKGVSIEYL
jgi:hypothetical protein